MPIIRIFPDMLNLIEWVNILISNRIVKKGKGYFTIEKKTPCIKKSFTLIFIYNRRIQSAYDYINIYKVHDNMIKIYVPNETVSIMYQNNQVTHFWWS